MTTRLVIVRHGETEWSRAGRHTGWTDVALTEAGKDEAAHLATRLAARTFAAVFTSPLRRAGDTAALAGFPRAELDDDLREWDYGEYEGLTTPQIRENRPGWFLWNGGVVGGETIDDVATRADSFIARARTIDGDVLVFSHGHLLRIVTARWLDQDPRLARHFILDPATISILGWEREVPAIVTWNV